MPNTTLKVVATMKARPEKTAELKALLETFLEPTRQESGCISYELLENLADPTEFTFVEEWQDQSALDAHFATAHIQGALGKLPDLLAAELDVRRYRLVG